MEFKESELKEYKSKASMAEKARIDLDLCLKESGEKILNDIKEQEVFKERLTNEKHQILKENQLLNANLKKMESEKTMLESNIKKLNGYIRILESDIKIIKEDLNNEDSMTNALKKLNKLMKSMQEDNRIVILPCNWLESNSNEKAIR